MKELQGVQEQEAAELAKRVEEHMVSFESFCADLLNRTISPFENAEQYLQEIFRNRSHSILLSDLDGTLGDSTLVGFRFNGLCEVITDLVRTPNLFIALTTNRAHRVLDNWTRGTNRVMSKLRSLTGMSHVYPGVDRQLPYEIRYMKSLFSIGRRNQVFNQLIDDLYDYIVGNKNKYGEDRKLKLVLVADHASPFSWRNIMINALNGIPGLPMLDEANFLHSIYNELVRKMVQNSSTNNLQLLEYIEFELIEVTSQTNNRPTVSAEP